jgi:hypothetical protein
MEKPMSVNEAEALRIYRLLKPEQQAEMLGLVHLACFAETSAIKSRNFDPITNRAFPINPQEYSCKN